MSQPRALIVEDERSWQQILSEILSDAGLAVDVVDGLENAVAALRQAPHRLAVVDLSLGGGDYYNQDGLQVLDAIRRQDPGCVAIMLTGFATVELAVHVLIERGALTCLRKETFRRAEFHDLVRQVLASPPPDYDPAGGASRAETDEADQVAAADEGVDRGWALIVEDDAGWRSILSELLADAGYRVRLCAGYGEALGYLRRDKYVLAIVDLALSNGQTPAGQAYRASSTPAVQEPLDGYRLLSSTQAAGIPTIVVTGAAGPEQMERAYVEHDVFACLEKQSFDRRAFLQTVQEARAAREGGTELAALTRREREVLELLAQGMTNKQIGQVLVVSTNTVKRHLKAIFDKLEVHTRSAAVAKAINL